MKPYLVLLLLDGHASSKIKLDITIDDTNQPEESLLVMMSSQEMLQVNTKW